MASGTLAPQAWFTGLDNNGAPVANGKLFTYAAGTTTKLATYSDVALTTPNANPIILDAGGRATIFLSSGSSYKFVLSPSTDTDPPTNPIRTQDNISAIPASSANLDVQGGAGEAISAGQGVYLSDGSGGKTAGLWYLWDADFPYANTIPEIGMATAAIASLSTGTIRLGGQVTGLTGLTVGTTYYVSATAGALTATAPTNARFVGVADSTTSLVLSPNPSRSLVDPSIVCGRLTATTGLAVTIADVSAATSIFFTPYIGNQIALYDGIVWVVRTFTEITISLVGLTASKPYDVFAYDNAGVVACETLVWTNATTRATALVSQDGVFVKSGALTRRYLGTVYINASGGQTDDTVLKRYLWNYYHRQLRTLSVTEATTNWAYTTATVRQARGSAANQVEAMIGLAEAPIDLSLRVMVANSTGGVSVSAGIGADSTTTFDAGAMVSGSAAGIYQMTARLTGTTIGYHKYCWNEWSAATGTTTWHSNVASVGSSVSSGLSGTVEG